jgi:hypothetical protein
MIKKMDLAFLSGKMVILIMAIFVTMSGKGRDKCYGRMEVATKENGRQAYPTDSVLLTLYRNIQDGRRKTKNGLLLKQHPNKRG